MSHQKCSPNDKKSFLRIVFFAGFALFLYRASILVHATFGDIGVEQIAYHLASPAVGVPGRLIREAIRELLIKPLVLMGLLYGLLWLCRHRLTALFKHAKNVIHASAWVVGALGSYDLYNTTGIGVYMQDRATAFEEDFDWFSRYYVRPTVSFDSSQKKLNLVWIYVESLETSRVTTEDFKTDKVFGSSGVRAFVNLPGTGWTVGGMAASQCGLPLMPVGLLGSNGLGDADHFLPKLQCLGDVLKQEGYVTEFIGGADASFAGKDKFLRTHGFDRVIGRQEIQDLTGKSFPSDYWGYTDRDVLDLVFDRVDALHKTDRPFFVNALTLNTHGPKGYLSAHCKQQGWKNNLDDIFSCALIQVRDFVARIERQGVLDNTVIVISGDHPFMGGHAGRLFSISEQRDRAVFFTVLRPDGQHLETPVMNHFDMFPTVLGALNFEVRDGVAGMGRNVYERRSLSQEVSVDGLTRALRQPSEKYRDAWVP